MSDFADFADLCRSTVETVHGDACRIFPVDRLDVNALPAASQARAPFDTTGCFHSDSQDPLRRVLALSVPGSRPMLNRPTALTCSLRFPGGAPAIKIGDRLRADEGRYAGRWFEISEIDPDGVGGAMVSLNGCKPLSDVS